MLTTVLFDLDGTLLPMDQDLFVQTYFKTLADCFVPRGYDSRKLMDAIWDGTTAMVKNDGSQTNETVFWNSFTKHFGPQAVNDIPAFEEFYRTDFRKAQKVCGCTPKAKQIIELTKSRGFNRILATNPLFPAIATEARIRWAGLEPEDFLFYTTYEDNIHCKPNPDYYRDILKRAHLRPEECLMVGNDVREDLAAASVGIPVFLLTDCLINPEQKSLREIPHGDFDALAEFLNHIS